MEDSTLYCYNKGCGVRFNPSENSETSCRYHPGQPVFHDALKGWSCCNKKSTDFTEFLNIPGCSTGFHTNEKPVVETPVQKPVEVPEMKPIAKPIQPPMERPSDKEPLVMLGVDIAPSYKLTLEKQMSENQGQNVDAEADNGVVTEGTSCRNNGCRTTYKDESSNDETCVYHSGIPIFHEGMKYWSCCQQKTTDFSNFLNQAGCISGKHVWTKKDDGTKVSCRHDWHQTPSFVTISVFSKLPSPAKTVVKVNKVVCSISIEFDNGKNIFQKDIVLRGVIDPEKSQVKVMGSKVEINLKKAEPGSWSVLEL